MTARTERFTGTVTVFEGPTAVIVKVYSAAGVVPEVVMFRVGMAGAITVSGLGVHTGVPTLWTGVTAQESVTSAPEGEESTVRFEVALLPGSTANGTGLEAVSVTCANAGASVPTSTMATSQAQTRAGRAYFPPAEIPVTWTNLLALEFTEMEFNMSRGWFNYVRFAGQSKGCPNALAARKTLLP